MAAFSTLKAVLSSALVLFCLTFLKALRLRPMLLILELVLFLCSKGILSPISVRLSLLFIVLPQLMNVSSMQFYSLLRNGSIFFATKAICYLH